MRSLPTACENNSKELPDFNGYACLALPVEILDRCLSGGDIDLELLLESAGVCVFLDTFMVRGRSTGSFSPI